MKLIKLLRINSSAVCPFQHSGTLDAKYRRILQNPAIFLHPFIHKGMNVLDLGCGTGFCTFDIARLLDGEGKVVAADLQTEMLNKVKQKAADFKFKELISFHKCEPESVNWEGEKFNLVLLFYMFHEIPNKIHLLNELKLLLQEGGKILISEPKFHVNSNLFLKESQIAIECGYKVAKGPNIFFSRTMILSAD